jgi:hypothetical protein
MDMTENARTFSNFDRSKRLERLEQHAMGPYWVHGHVAGGCRVLTSSRHQIAAVIFEELRERVEKQHEIEEDAVQRGADRIAFRGSCEIVAESPYGRW